MNENEEAIDWSLTTWEGSRRAQLRDAMKLTLTEKWQAVEEMADWARATIASRRARGLPYIDPYTGERVPGKLSRDCPIFENGGEIEVRPIQIIPGMQ